jgi:hypothetical protein
MSSESQTEQITRLQGYLTETYRLLYEAEKTLPLLADPTERSELRQKIGEYERFLTRWRHELEDVKGPEEEGENTVPEIDFGPAYYMDLARRAFSRGLFLQARELSGIVRNHDPVYPGLEVFERRVEESIRANPVAWVEPEHTDKGGESSASLYTRPRFWVLVSGALVLVIAAAIITLLFTANRPPGNSPVSRPPAKSSPGVLTVDNVVRPPATDAPFLVATPTPPVQPTVPPELFSQTISRPAATSPPAPTPTRR